MTSEQPTPPSPAGARAGARPPEPIGPHRIHNTAITREYVEMLPSLGRNEEAATIEAKAR